MKEPVSKGSDVRRFSLNVFLRGCSSLRSINLFFYIPGIKIKRYNSHSGSGARVGEEYFIRPCFSNDRLSIYCEISKILKSKGISTCPEANIFKHLSKSLIHGGVHFSWGQERIALPPQRENPLSSSRVSSSLARIVYLARACCLAMALITSEPGYPDLTFRVSTASYFVISSYTEKVDLPTCIRLQIHIALSPGGMRN